MSREDVTAAASNNPSGRTGDPPALECAVIAGPDQGRSLLIDKASPPRVLVGKSPASDLQLADPKVSRRHLAFEIDGARIRARDLGSTNGTLVNGVSLIEGFVAGGEVLRLGDTTLRLTVREAQASKPAPNDIRFGRLYGVSPAMRRIYPVCKKLAASNVPVIIEGETGTGKEVLAEAIHATSPRAQGPFVVVDCTTLAASVIESELFGHEKGAFTGAVATRKGAFEQAHGGTLFIDEVGDLDPSLQPKLLRAIERSEIRRVGGDKWIKVDVRIVSATRRDLDRSVEEGRFRDDLFFRLAVGRVELPPLRRRQGDVAFLAELFWNDLGGEAPVPPELLRRLEGHAFPGNVRELHNTIARHLALGELAGPSSVRAARPEASGAAAAGRDYFDEVIAQKLPLTLAKQHVIAEFERRYVEAVLRDAGGSVSKAAEASGIALRYFQILRARASK